MQPALFPRNPVPPLEDLNRRVALGWLLLTVCLPIFGCGKATIAPMVSVRENLEVPRRLTVPDAVETIRRFERNPHLQVSVPSETASILARATGPVHSSVDFQADRYLYGFGPYPGMMTRTDALYAKSREAYYANSGDWSARRSKAISSAQALGIARAFVSSHFPKPDVLNKVKLSETVPSVRPDVAGGTRELPGSARPEFPQEYHFEFQQDCGEGVLGPSRCFVTVESVNRQVVSCMSIYHPLLISTHARLTKAQATDAAALSLPVRRNGPQLTLPRKFVDHPDAAGREHLFYFVPLHGFGPPRRRSVKQMRDSSLTDRLAWSAQSVADSFHVQDYYAVVDANSGEVREWDRIN